VIELKYPVILVHGAGFRNKTVGVKYWGRVPRYLMNEGPVFHLCGTDMWGAVESNGALIKKGILEVLAVTGTEKVNIIAHSKGGLEARYAISALGMENAVASLTTISTPHRGIRAMNIILKFPQWLYRLVSIIVNGVSILMGDFNPDFFLSSRQFSESLCSEFNRNCPDKDGIYYQSYASVLCFFFGNLMLLLTWIVVRIFDGPNDGLCPVESAKWGNFRGTVTGRRLLGVSHNGIRDFYRLPFWSVRIAPPSAASALPPEQRDSIGLPELYVSIVRELGSKGF
jgi:triacylglycerol lipase